MASEISDTEKNIKEIGRSGNLKLSIITDIIDTEKSNESADNNIRNKWPHWVTSLHLIIIVLIFVAGIGGCIAITIYSSSTIKHTNNVKTRTGFRTMIVILHILINILVFGLPYAVWYRNNFEMKCETEEELPMSARKLFYSYAINDGYGHQIASVGLSISNIMFALIIVFRYEYLLPATQMKLFKFENRNEIAINYAAGETCLLLGIIGRCFASGVPAFNVQNWQIVHYVFAGSMFLISGIHMLVEVIAVDTSIPEKCRESLPAGWIIRRGCVALYWFGFAGMMLFGKASLNLMALSSACELLSLLANEMYIATYIAAFREFDASQPYF